MLKVLIGTYFSALAMTVSRMTSIQVHEAKLQIMEETKELHIQPNLKSEVIGAKREIDYYEKLPLLLEDENNLHTIKV